MSKKEDRQDEPTVCPQCGYCPHCGRAHDAERIVYVPYVVPQPVPRPWYVQPYPPYWYQPVVTSGGSLSVSALPGVSNTTLVQ